MASPRARLPHNTPGDFYVDAACIDCHKCQRLAPAHFARRDGRSHVIAQPATADERTACQAALAGCPVSAIGDDGLEPLPVSVRRLLPDLWSLAHPSPLTEGAAAYLIVRPHGNVLVDVPDYDPDLLTALEDLGDLRYIFVTHEDTLGELDRFQAHFGAEVIMHAAEAHLAPMGVDLPFDAETKLFPDLMAIPTPGHTAGSSCLLWRRHGGCLFTGDHLAPFEGGLAPVRYDGTADWDAQLASAKRLLDAPWQHAFPAREVETLPLGYVRDGKRAMADAMEAGATSCRR